MTSNVLPFTSHHLRRLTATPWPNHCSFIGRRDNRSSPKKNITSQKTSRPQFPCSFQFICRTTSFLGMCQHLALGMDNVTALLFLPSCPMICVASIAQIVCTCSHLSSSKFPCIFLIMLKNSRGLDSVMPLTRPQPPTTTQAHLF